MQRAVPRNQNQILRHTNSCHVAYTSRQLCFRNLISTMGTLSSPFPSSVRLHQQRSACLLSPDCFPSCISQTECLRPSLQLNHRSNCKLHFPPRRHDCSRLPLPPRAAVQFPADYDQLIRQVTNASKAALADSKKLLEIEFPTAGLSSVPGDAEGGIEMTKNIGFIRNFCEALVPSQKAAATRVFLPDANEVDVARAGEFEGTGFQLDFLTKPSGLEDFGLGGFGKKLRMADRAKPSDEMFVVAYPSFNVNEILAVEELFQDSAESSGRPIIVFNGELDRIRSGYYPSFFYPKLAALAKSFLPRFETAYYIHNFKGSQGGALFRAYPGPWQVLRRVDDDYLVVHEQSAMPSLKEVALNILPAGRGA